MRAIAIHGKARSGKDEIAKILLNAYGFTHIGFADKLKEFAVKYFELDPTTIYEKKTKESRQILQGIGIMVRNDLFSIEGAFNESKDTYSWAIGVSGYPNFIQDLAVKYFCVDVLDLGGRKQYVKSVLNGISNFLREKVEELVLTVNAYKAEDIWVNYLFTKEKTGLYVISDLRFKNEKEKVKQFGGKTVKVIRVDGPEIEAGKFHQSEVDLDMETDWDYTIVNEHDSDWYEKLEISVGNMLRHFYNDGFISGTDKLNFKVQI